MKRAACLIGLLVAITVSAQQMATMKSPKKVKQGEEIHFQITTDKPASIFGNVAMEASPSDGGPSVSSHAYSLGGQSVTIPVGIPVDAKPGKWKITKVYFQANSGGIRKDLAPEGDLSFEVMPNQSVDLPSEATVEIR